MINYILNHIIIEKSIDIITRKYINFNLLGNISENDQFTQIIDQKFKFKYHQCQILRIEYLDVYDTYFVMFNYEKVVAARTWIYPKGKTSGLIHDFIFIK